MNASGMGLFGLSGLSSLSSLFGLFRLFHHSAFGGGNWKLVTGYWDILNQEELLPRPYALVPRPF